MSETAEQYAAEKFARLTDREHIRVRAGMYIGNVDIAGLHHLAGELINNSVDEVMGGHATQITVTIHRDGSLSVEDDGRGIPVDKHEEESARQERDVSVLEFVLTQLRMGVKHNKAAKTSSGQFGIGLKAVNFLSRWCEVRVCRRGFEYRLRIEDGVVGQLEQLGPTSRRGTHITFQPDPEIFTTTDFDFVRLQSRLRELALLHPRLTTRIHDERTRAFQFEQGLSQLVDELAAPQMGCSETFRLEAEGFGAQIEIAFQFTGHFEQQTRLYVNDLLLPGGGTPVVGLVAGVARAIREEAKTNRFDGDLSLCEEFPQRLTAVIAVRHPEPYFAAATRHKLTNPELEGFVELVVFNYLQKRFAADPTLAPQQWEMAKLATARRREMQEAEYETD